MKTWFHEVSKGVAIILLGGALLAACGWTISEYADYRTLKDEIVDMHRTDKAILARLDGIETKVDQLIPKEVEVINTKDMIELVIRPTLESMERLWPGASREAAVNLMAGTMGVESTIKGVTHLKQVGGVALGIYQIEPDTHADIWATYLSSREEKAKFIRGLASQHPHQGLETELVANLPYSTAIARIKYYRRRFTWPEDPNNVEALARIWKDHYNTNRGKGTVVAFVEKYPL